MEEKAAEPPAATILFQTGMTEAALRDKAAIGHLQAALERAQDRPLRTRVALPLAEMLGAAGQWEAALEIADAAEKAVGDRHPDLAGRAHRAADRARVAAGAHPDGGDGGAGRRAIGCGWPRRWPASSSTRRAGSPTRYGGWKCWPPRIRSRSCTRSCAGRSTTSSRERELLRDAGATSEAVATHLAQVTPSRSRAVAAALVEAGERTLTQAAPDEAARWFRRALTEDATEPPAPAILASLGMTEGALRDPAAIGHLQDALRQAQDRELRTRVAVSPADMFSLAGQWDAALAVIGEARRELTDRDRDAEALAEVAPIELMVTAYEVVRLSRDSWVVEVLNPELGGSP